LQISSSVAWMLSESHQVRICSSSLSHCSLSGNGIPEVSRCALCRACSSAMAGNAAVIAPTPPTSNSRRFISRSFDYSAIHRTPTNPASSSSEAWSLNPYLAAAGAPIFVRPGHRTDAGVVVAADGHAHLVNLAVITERPHCCGAARGDPHDEDP